MLGVLAKSAVWLGLFATGMMCYRIVSGTYYIAPGDWSAYWPFVAFAICVLLLALGPRTRV
jgi:hypothetical protein